MECGAGLGLLLMLRWFWFRISAWAEIAATLTPFAVYGLLKFGLSEQYPVLKSSISENPTSFFITVGVTSLVWIVVSLVGPKNNAEHLKQFKARIYPEGYESFKGRIPFLFMAWFGGIVAVYSFLFATGKFIFKEYSIAFILLACMTAGFFCFRYAAKKAKLF